jgi:hypothetical protein
MPKRFSYPTERNAKEVKTNLERRDDIERVSRINRVRSSRRSHDGTRGETFVIDVWPRPGANIAEIERVARTFRSKDRR